MKINNESSYIEQLYATHRQILKAGQPVCYNVQFSDGIRWNESIDRLYNGLLDCNLVYVQVNDKHWHICTLGKEIKFTPVTNKLEAIHGATAITAPEFVMCIEGMW